MSKKESLSSKSKIGLLFLILSLGFGVALLWSGIKVTWVNGDMWRKRAEALSKNYIPEKANRGNIYSSDGKILATTVPECDLYIDFRTYPLRNKDNKIVIEKGDTVYTSAIVDSNYNK